MTAPVRRAQPIRVPAVMPRPVERPVHPRDERSRRTLNVVVAVVLLLLTVPLMLAIALAIRLTSPGPVLFRQVRVGLRTSHGQSRRFTMLKFRTMTCDHGREACWAAEDDQRVTPVGRVLRKFRLDELPQLVNVLRGDMNVVGPRPEQPEIVERLRRRIHRYPERHRVLPGITGWAQINQGYDRTLDDVRKKLALDLEYIARRSALEDLRIMLRTVPVMVGRRGAL